MPHSASVRSRMIGVSVHGPVIRLIVEPDFRKRLLRAHRAERVGSGKDDLEIGAPRFQTGKELGHIGTEQIAAAFHHQGVGRQREAEIERIDEDVADPLATRRIGASEGRNRCNRKPAPRRNPGISLSPLNDEVPVAFRAITVVWPCMRSARKTATPAVVFPTSPEVPSKRYTGVLRSVLGGARHGELPNVQRLAAVPAHRPEIAYAPEVPLFEGESPISSPTTPESASTQ